MSIAHHKIKYEALLQKIVEALAEGETETEDGEDLREEQAHVQGVLWGLHLTEEKA